MVINQINYSIFLYDLSLLTNSTLPQSFNNLTQIRQIEFAHLPNLRGQFPSNFLRNNKQLNRLKISNINQLDGYFDLETLCNIYLPNFAALALQQFDIQCVLPRNLHCAQFNSTSTISLYDSREIDGFYSK